MILLNKPLSVPNKGVWLFFVFYEAIVARRILMIMIMIMMMLIILMMIIKSYLQLIHVKKTIPSKH